MQSTADRGNVYHILIIPNSNSDCTASSMKSTIATAEFTCILPFAYCVSHRRETEISEVKFQEVILDDCGFFQERSLSPHFFVNIVSIIIQTLQIQLRKVSLEQFLLI